MKLNNKMEHFKQELLIFRSKFCKSFDVEFANAEGKQEYVWEHRGVSTRLMGLW
jgi:hypothetical protein